MIEIPLDIILAFVMAFGVLAHITLNKITSTIQFLVIPFHFSYESSLSSCTLTHSLGMLMQTAALNSMCVTSSNCGIPSFSFS